MPTVAAYSGTETTMDDALGALYRKETTSNDQVTILRSSADQEIKGTIDTPQGSQRTGVVHPPEETLDYQVVDDMHDRLVREGVEEEEATYFARQLRDNSSSGLVIVEVDDNKEKQQVTKIFNEAQATIHEL